MLRVDPASRGRLADIITNLGLRITEAQQRGWLGEVQGLQISLEAARTKLTALDRTHGPVPVKLTRTNSPLAGQGSMRLPSIVDSVIATIDRTQIEGRAGAALFDSHRR